MTSEKISDYDELLNELVKLGYKFSSFTIDGRRGVKQLLEAKFGKKPIQHCQFHQVQTVTKYLSRNPKLESGKELRDLVLTLSKTCKKIFVDKLEEWFINWEVFWLKGQIWGLKSILNLKILKLGALCSTYGKNVYSVVPKIQRKMVNLKIDNNINV